LLQDVSSFSSIEKISPLSLLLGLTDALLPP
jgi:hypothetical protein